MILPTQTAFFCRHFVKMQAVPLTIQEASAVAAMRRQAAARAARPPASRPAANHSLTALFQKQLGQPVEEQQAVAVFEVPQPVVRKASEVTQSDIDIGGAVVLHRRGRPVQRAVGQPSKRLDFTASQKQDL